MNESIRSTIEKAPTSSGCYIFKNKHDVILYIGKSKSLKKRLKSYYNKVHEHHKLNKLVNEATKIELILTENETEALILECDLIKKIKPIYNSDLKKNRQNYYMRIGRKEEFPSITIEDKVHKDGGKYYGVYNKPEYVEESIILLNEIWKTPTCNKFDLKKIDRPCIQWDMKKCVAPCGKISSDEYKKITREIIRFFNTDNETIYKKLEKQLQSHVKKLEFEKAGEVNERLNNIKKLRRKIKRLDRGVDYKNVILFFRGYNEEGLSIFYIEKEKVLFAYRFNRLDFQEAIACDFINKVKNKNYDYVDKYNLKNLQDIKCDKMFGKIDFSKDNETILEELKVHWNDFLS